MRVSFPHVWGLSALPLCTELGAWKGCVCAADVGEVWTSRQRNEYVNNQHIVPGFSLARGHGGLHPEAPPVIWGSS